MQSMIISQVLDKNVTDNKLKTTKIGKYSKIYSNLGKWFKNFENKRSKNNAITSDTKISCKMNRGERKGSGRKPHIVTLNRSD